IGRREVDGLGEAGDVGAAGPVHCNGVGLVVAAAAQVGRVEQAIAGRVYLGDEDVVEATLVVGLDSADGREIGRTRPAGDVGVARTVHRYAMGIVFPATAQVARIDEAPRSSELGHEGVKGSALKDGLNR